MERLELQNEPVAQILVSAFLPGKGGVHRSFVTVKTRAEFGGEPLKFFEPPQMFANGPDITTADMLAGGVTPYQLGQRFAEWLRSNCAEIMEQMRRRKVNVHGSGKEIFAIGGQSIPSQRPQLSPA